MKKKEFKPKEKELPTCAYCSRPVHDGVDGGKCAIPMMVSGLWPQSVYLHNSCLKPYLKQAEANREPFKPNTHFTKDKVRIN